MVANHIHDALDQVRRMREIILERRKFRGFSGEARIASGFGALAGTLILASGRLPATATAHLAVWGAVLVFALAANYGALAHWFLRDPARRRDLLALKPAVDVIPAYAAGAALSAAAIRGGWFDALPGLWMIMHGLAHTACRLSLPRANTLVGLAYMAAGAACLLAPGCPFLNPWPVGVAFFLGESLGGAILLRDRHHGAPEHDAPPD